MKKLLAIVAAIFALILSMSSCTGDHASSQSCKDGHSFTSYVSNGDATCEHDGTKTATCDRCDSTETITDTGSKLEHSFGEYLTNNNATCERDGTKSRSCSVCAATDTVTDIGSKLHHSFTAYLPDGNATCERDGTKTAKCDRCDALDTTTDEGSAGHLFKSYVSNGDATCTEDGTKTAVCIRNDCEATDTLTDEGSAGHLFKSYVSNGDATCTEDGTKSAKCARCDAVDTVTEDGSALKHDFSGEYLFDEEYHYHKCKVCDTTDTKLYHTLTNGKCDTCTYTVVSPDYGDVTVMLPGEEVNIIVVENRDTLKLYDVYSDFVKLGFRSWICDVYEPVIEHEIVFGYDKRREISRTAYDILYSMSKDSYYDMRYLVYADSGKVCVAYDYNEYTDLGVVDLIKKEVFETLLGGKDYITVDKGVLMQGRIDLIAEQKKLDEVKAEEQWAARKEALVEKWGEEKGLEIYEAYKSFYSLCDDGLVVWAANLYDSGVGGYYATSSGRDHIGYAPSPELTEMHLRLAGNLGAPDDMKTIIPDIMKYQIVYFCKFIQDPDGYFYPPMAKKSDYRAGGVAARARNLSAAITLLRAFGAGPTYDTSTGQIGDGITADEYWNDLRERGLVNQDPPNVPRNVEDIESGLMSIRTSVATAVSSVLDTSVSAAASTKNELNDYKLFIDWIEKYNLKKSPYGAGNTIQARSQEIKTASEKMQPAVYTPTESEASNPKYAKYAGLTMREIAIKYMNDSVNPETGIWGDPDLARPGTNGTEFLYTNGFFKVVSAYNILGAPLPYPEKAAEALLLGTISSEASNTNSCDVYNIWSGLTMLQSNVKTQYAGEENAEIRESTLAKIDELIAEFGAEPILVSYEKQKRYQKEDGSFSHNVNTSNPLHQGPHPVGLGWREGDVDAIGKCLWGTIAPINSVYGAKGVSYYYEHHFMMYMEILVSNGPIVKCDADTAGHTKDECEANTRLDGPVFEPLIVTPEKSEVTQTEISSETAFIPAVISDLSYTSKKRYIA